MAASFRMSRLWFALGNNDIASRYRGSVLGPFWITLTTIVFVSGLGFLYAALMHLSVAVYLPWLATGIVLWNMMNQTIMDGGDAFISMSNILRQTALPLPLFIWRLVWRNVLIFAHQLPVILIVAVVFHYVFKINLFLAVFGMALAVINISWIAFCCAIACARFRDLQQVLASVMQLLFFLSPIMWVPGSMHSFTRITEFNPVTHLLDVIRSPLLGRPMEPISVPYLLVMAVVGWAFTMVFFSLVRRRIVHYV